MPEVHLTLEWPDGSTSALYSPSTVILQRLRPGQSLPVSTLRIQGIAALQEASERVRVRYGFACTRTNEERHKLERMASRFDDAECVQILS
jgi:uncharacterized repeat protein (TIGR04042 family)